ncbi:MAG TPA: hypothetical protein VK638_58415 [Edaphobacter sp.]|nr:hypothetical protein [Edaphobacter sp.]
MKAQPQTRAGRSAIVLILLILLCLTWAGTTAVSHMHLHPGTAGSQTHCELCALSAVLVATVSVALLWFGLRVSTVSFVQITTSYQHVELRSPYIRPPPVLTLS